jgi:hypothetical protein
MSNEFESFVNSWRDYTRIVAEMADTHPPLADAVVEQQPGVDDRVDDDVIDAELAAIRDRAARRSELAHADILFAAGDVAGACELWERVASSGHPIYSARARHHLAGLRRVQPIGVSNQDLERLCVQLTEKLHARRRCGALPIELWTELALGLHHPELTLGHVGERLNERVRRIAMEEILRRSYAASRRDQFVGRDLFVDGDLGRDKDRAD